MANDERPSRKETVPAAHPKTEPAPLSISFYVILGVALFAFIRTFSLLSPILLSFLLVLLVSLAVNPMISRMRSLTGGRKIPTGLVVAGLVSAMALVGWSLFGPMKDSVIKISDAVPGYWERLQKPLIKMEQQAVIFEEKLQAEVSTEIAREDGGAKEPETIPRTTPSPLSPEESNSLRSRLNGMFQDLLGSFTAVAFNGAQILVVLVTVFFGVVFMLMNPRPVFGAMLSLLPEEHHPKALVILQRIGKFIPAWAGATALGMLTIGSLVFLLMWPIFGFMDALVLGLIAGVLEAVPFLGPILSALPALLLALGQGGMTPLWVLLAYGAVQALENNMIMPFIMARGMKLHPLAVIFSMLLCVAAFGVLGVLMAAPLVAIVRIVHDELYRKRFLPHVTDADLDHLAGLALHEIRPDEK
ncbi:MAG: AI-2E family transporter [Desulfobacula sp.]|nr:AI-2E family transporter [Desulfobacula sp.]